MPYFRTSRRAVLTSLLMLSRVPSVSSLGTGTQWSFYTQHRAAILNTQFASVAYYVVDGPAARPIRHFNGHFSLHGHPAGGQFAARYLVIHSNRLDQMILSAPSCPMLCLTDSTDYPEVHQQTREAVADTPNTTVRNFTAADRTEGYRELDNFSLKHRVMFDWLDEVFGYWG
jgi:alpha-beta hydrolase superfamily lysophospholipase